MAVKKGTKKSGRKAGKPIKAKSRKKPIKKALKKSAKKPIRKPTRKPAKKARPRTVKKKPVRKAKPVKKKPARKPVKKRPVKRAKARKAPAKRAKKVLARKPALPQIKVSKIVDGVISGITLGQEMRLKAVKKLASSTKLPSVQEGLCSEEIALKMLDVYFTEVARYGLKRKLSLDEVINAYFYALLRVQRKGLELEEVKKAALRD
jgi:hypothetical protein